MKKGIPKSRGGSRPGAGRPATGRDPVRAIRLSDEFLGKVDGWAAKQPDNPGRSEAIRQLVEIGLTRSKSARPRSAKNAARAKQLAANTIDRLVDPAAPIEEAANRKRRLLKGPEEFRELRVDHEKSG